MNLLFFTMSCQVIRFPRLVLSLIILLIAPSLNAADAFDNVIQQIDLEVLARNNHWRSLIHYEATNIEALPLQSQVDDDNFFLSQNGKNQPLEELRATLRAFYRPLGNPNQHPLCKFPARWQWLSNMLELPAPPIELSDCPDFNKWLDIIKPYSATLVFASAYLNSPSSMYGHTFLRIDPKNVDSGTNWLSYAVNFGAEVHPDDNSILYAYRGLFGGYPGFFSVLPYHQKIHEYSRLENRDLWEYQLNLRPDEVRRMVWHLWELRNIDFDYFFFDENCSYRLLELLEVARPGVKLTDGFEFRAIPVDTVRAVAREDMIEQLIYRPSEATDLQYQADLLNPEQQKTALRLTGGDDDLDGLEPSVKTQVLRVAYKHLRYQQLKKDRNPEAAHSSFRLLKRLNDQPPAPVAVAPQPIAPDNGHETRLLGLAVGRRDGVGWLDLRLRASYHDLLDNTDGYPDGAAINIGELRLRKPEGKSLQLEQLNFVDINSHSPRTPFFSPITWRVKAGFNRLYTADSDTLVSSVDGGVGVTRLLTEQQRHLFYGMGVARLEYNRLLEDNLAIGAGVLAGGLCYLPFGTLQLEGQHMFFSDGGDRTKLMLGQNLQLGKDHAFRINLTHNKQMDTHFNEIGLEYRYYY